MSYETLSERFYRHERATKVKTTSKEAGRIFEFSDGIINGDAKGLLENLAERYKWMWDWSGEKEVEHGLHIIAESVKS